MMNRSYLREEEWENFWERKQQFQDPVAGGFERRPVESECREDGVCEHALRSRRGARSQTVQGHVSYCFKYSRWYSDFWKDHSEYSEENRLKDSSACILSSSSIITVDMSFLCCRYLGFMWHQSSQQYHKSHVVILMCQEGIYWIE